jgi:galactose mutarotase-like enzyme/CHAD domain-containing protein
MSGVAFKAIRLDSGGGLSATFVPGAGMVGVSLIHDGGEHLDQREGISAWIERSATMGLPILYPWANRLSRDNWKFDGTSVVIEPDAYRIHRDENGYAIHGTLAASALWNVEQAEVDEDRGSATLRATLDFGDHPQLLSSFPFPHLLELEYRVSGDELSVTTTVTPTGDVAVPLAYGFHPYLTLPGGDRSDWRVRLPGMLKLESDRRHIPTGNTHLDRESDEPLGERDLDDSYSAVPEGAVFSVSNASTAIEVRFERGYPAAQVYAPAGQDFICFEPMKSPVNALVTGRELASVEPGQSDTAQFSIRIGPAPTDPDPGPDGSAHDAQAIAGSEAKPAIALEGDEQEEREDEEQEEHVEQEPSKEQDTEPGPEEERERNSNLRRFRLDPETDAAEEVRRVASGRAESAVSSLRESEPGARAAAVHTARKDMKKMRAVLRLVRSEIGKKTYRSENERFRDAARKLSDARDAEVLTGTVDSLLDDHPDDAPPVESFRAELERRREEASGHGAEDTVEVHVSQAAEEIAAGAEAISQWPLKRSDWKLFEPGLHRSYRDGRAALKVVAKGDPESEAMHEFRKRVKDLWYEMRLLRDCWEEGLAGVVDQAGLLSDLLGDYNDLSVLLEEIATRDEDDENLLALAALAEEKQSRLLGRALPIAKRLYAEKPDAFTARIGAYWSA